MNEFESHAHAGEILIRIIASVLIWIQDSQCRWRSFVFVRQVMIGNDDVESISPGPMQRLARAVAANHADGQIIFSPHPFLSLWLFKVIDFGGASLHLVALAAPQQPDPRPLVVPVGVA